jgi:predicted phosphodiesterase
VTVPRLLAREHELLANEHRLLVTVAGLLACQHELLANEHRLLVTVPGLLAREHELLASEHRLLVTVPDLLACERELLAGERLVFMCDCAPLAGEGRRPASGCLAFASERALLDHERSALTLEPSPPACRLCSPALSCRRHAMLLLCVSDIHGHLDALRAVLATAERRAFHKLLVAGDIVFPGPDALETWRRLSAAGAVMVQGLTDRAVATLDPAALHPRSDHERERLEQMKATRDALGELILQRLRRLPTHQRIPLEDGGELLLVHGSPSDPGEALTHDMSDAEVNALLGDDPADVVVCGASHVPFDRMVGGVRIVNVGSVGEAPGASPRVAHATWIESTPRGVEVESIAVPLEGAAGVEARP